MLDIGNASSAHAHSWLRKTMAGYSLVFEEPCGGEGASVGGRGASMVKINKKGLECLVFMLEKIACLDALGFSGQKVDPHCCCS